MGRIERREATEEREEGGGVSRHGYLATIPSLVQILSKRSYKQLFVGCRGSHVDHLVQR
jgi:hypothetical protein